MRRPAHCLSIGAAFAVLAFAVSLGSVIISISASGDPYGYGRAFASGHYAYAFFGRLAYHPCGHGLTYAASRRPMLCSARGTVLPDPY